MLLKRWERRQKWKEETLLVYQRYSAPLFLAAESLFWRLKEVLGEEGWGDYLNVKEPRTTFEEYKRLSTMYRLAALLAWIRALRRELAILTHYNERLSTPIHEALVRFERALADGPDVELERNTALAKLWEITLPNDPMVQRRIGRRVENHIKMFLQERNESDPSHLSSEQSNKLCTEVRDIICSEMHTEPISDAIVEETRSRAIKHIGIREAWLYRDWQSAIGDILIREVPAGDRKFEVFGFLDFLRQLNSEDEQEKKLLNRLGTLVEQINIKGERQFDARIAQLEAIHKATSAIVVAIARAERRQRFPQKTCKEAEKELIGLKEEYAFLFPGYNVGLFQRIFSH